MNEQKILQELTTIFHQVFDNENIVLNEKMTADDVEGWDSFNHVTLVVATEAHFKVKFHSAEIEELKNVGDLVRAIHRKLDEKNA